MSYNKIIAHKAAKFIGAYEALCREHEMMVIMRCEDEQSYHGFTAALVDTAEQDVIGQACEEMRIRDVFHLGDRPK